MYRFRNKGYCIRKTTCEQSKTGNLFEQEDKTKKVKVLVNHRRRYDEKIIDLRKKIKSGIIGKITQVSSFYVYGVLTTGTHLVDTLRMLLNDTAGEVKKVIGFNNYFGFHCPKDDKNIDGILIFENNLKATIQSLDIKKYDNFDIYLYGTKGKILISGIGRLACYLKS